MIFLLEMRKQLKNIPSSPNLAENFTSALFNPIKNEHWFKTERIKKINPKPQVSKKRIEK